MRRGRSGIGAELVPLILILASLAGSLALVIAIHRRFVTRSRAENPPVAVVAIPSPSPAQPRAIARPVPAAPTPKDDEPEPPPPAPPEDPTPKVVARIVAAEADQLLEASKADRKAAALDAARKAALLESEKWRRRESLVRLQVDSLQTKLHQLETQADELTLERDALEKEVDARKALAAQARSRPSTAILPHKGQNGTWRRPIVIECVNGTAILRPQGLSFGLLELAMGFGPSTNPFVAAVAREAIRIQGNASPDGQVVTPYIFFLVRPDGIRTYYEARGRLEALGITFGYELADQDWEIDFPDLDDIKTWDGSGPPTPTRPDPLANLRSRTMGASAAEDESFTNLGKSLGLSDEAPGSEFVFPPQPRGGAPGNGRVTLGGTGSGIGSGGIGNPGGSRLVGVPGSASGIDRPGGLANAGPGVGRPGGGIKFPGGPSGPVITEPGEAPGTVPGDLPPLAAPRELTLGGPIAPLEPNAPGSPASPSPSPGSSSLPPVVSPRTSPPSGSGALAKPPQTRMGSAAIDPTDPASATVLASPGMPDPNAMARSSIVSPDQTPPVRHIGPFSKPLAEGLDPALLANASSPPKPVTMPDDFDPSQPDSNNNPASNGSPSANPSTSPNGSPGGSKPASSTTTPPPQGRVVGPGDSSISPPPTGSPPPLTVGMGSPPPPPRWLPPNMMPSNMTPPPADPNAPPRSSRPKTNLAPSDNFKIIDGKYEVVVVCTPRGVIVQPGAYRVTLDALKSREGLLKTQIVGLVKAKRTANPKQTIQPTVRFLVQSGGEPTYWLARSQFLLSGLDWPVSMQVADRDHLTILPSESW